MEETVRVKQKVHEGRMKNLSKNEEDLKVRIMSVWNDCKTNEEKIRKALN